MAKKIAPVLDEILRAVDGIQKALVGKTLRISRANGSSSMVSNAALKSFPRLAAISRWN